MSPLRLDISSRDSDSDGDSSSFASFPGFSPSVASSQTSHWERSSSPSPSILSLTSSLREASFTHEYGRGLNTYSDVYRFPADEQELDRLDKLHVTLMGLMGKYPPSFADVLSDDVPGEQKAILDLGCGSGAWITEVAREFPHCSAVAVDLIPMQHGNMPPNCRSEVDDINLGLEHFYGDFNVVHTRLIQSGIKDYAGLVHHISHVLRPGGLVELVEIDYMIYSIQREPIEINLSRMEEPFLPRWFAFLKMAVRGRGGTVDAARHMRSWVCGHGAFKDVVCREFWIPTCPWAKGMDPESRWWNSVGQAYREDIVGFLTAGRPLLLGSGLAEHVVDELQEKSVMELMQCKYPGLLRARTVYASKKEPQPE